MVDPEPELAPVITPVIVPTVQANELGADANNAMFVAAPLQIDAVFAVVTVGVGLTFHSVYVVEVEQDGELLVCVALNWMFGPVAPAVLILITPEPFGVTADHDEPPFKLTS